MKRALRLPLHFLLLFLAVFIVLTVFSVFLRLGATFDPTIDTPASRFSVLLILSGRDVLPAAILSSVVLLLFRLVSTGGNRVLSLFLIGLSGFVVFVGGLLVADGLVGAMQPDALSPSYSVPEQQFLSFPEADVYVGEADFLRLSPVIVYRDADGPGFARFGSAVRDPDANQLLIPEAGLAFSISDARQAYVSLFEPPAFLAGLFRDVSLLTERLTITHQPGSPLFYLTPLSLVMVAVSSWCFVRLTRWPLFNGMLVLVFIRGMMFVYSLFEGEFIGGLLEGVLDPRVLSYLAPAFLTLIAVVLFSIAMLMPPFEQWRREVSDE